MTNMPINKAEIETILEKIYAALLEKGYDPSSQLAGYILSEDPVFKLISNKTD